MRSERSSALPFVRALSLLLAAGLLGACGDDPETPAGPDRSGRVDAGTTETGGRRPTGGRDAGDTARDAATEADAEPDDAGPGSPDVAPLDTGGAPDTDPAPTECDQDGDGFLSIACGGDDCDDTDRRVHPGAPEACDYVDQDCDGTLNNGVECLIYAHTSNELFLVDPFVGTTTRVTSTPPSLFDFDTAPGGGLYGIAGSSLYRFDVGSARWDTIGTFSGVTGLPNGFAIDNGGTGWITGARNVWRMDLSNARTDLVSSNTGFTSSGDCVVDKGDVLYMSASNGSSDQLVIIDGTTGDANLVGDIGFGQVYGLAAAWGYLFGFTSSGQLIEIDTSTGRGTLRHTLRDSAGRAPVWYGSASSPGR